MAGAAPHVADKRGQAPSQKIKRAHCNPRANEYKKFFAGDVFLLAATKIADIASKQFHLRARSGVKLYVYATNESRTNGTVG
jgi:hypothetical protein